MSENQLDEIRGKMLLLGSRAVVRMGNRYIIYLPTHYNRIWRVLNKSKLRVLVFIEIPADEEGLGLLYA